MKTKFLILGFILAIAVIGCKNVTEDTKTPDPFSISYLVGSSWTDYSYKATINQNGLLRVTFNNRVSNYRITNSELASIKEKLDDISLVNIQDRYGFGAGKPFDLPVKVLQYNTNSKTDSTVIYFPDENELPIELNLFLSAINKLILDNDSMINK
jgi:hypothetical protein